jgi:two-component system, chemotaxis family, chemotaxis protein CheY
MVCSRPMRRVLLVEDSASMRTFVRAALTSATALGELEIAEAQSGFDALRLLPRGAWDLVITDINMPDINGLELISFIKKSEAHRATPILIISTASSERDRDRGMSLGASSYLVKPFTAEVLVAHVREQLGLEPASGAHA